MKFLRLYNTPMTAIETCSRFPWNMGLIAAVKQSFELRIFAMSNFHFSTLILDKLILSEKSGKPSPLMKFYFKGLNDGL